MASYGLGFTHSDISEKCREVTEVSRGKKSIRRLRSLWSRAVPVKSNNLVDTVLTIRPDHQGSQQPQTRILGGGWRPEFLSIIQSYGMMCGDVW